MVFNDLYLVFPIQSVFDLFECEAQPSVSSMWRLPILSDMHADLEDDVAGFSPQRWQMPSRYS